MGRPPRARRTPLQSAARFRGWGSALLVLPQAGRMAGGVAATAPPRSFALRLRQALRVGTGALGISCRRDLSPVGKVQGSDMGGLGDVRIGGAVQLASTRSVTEDVLVRAPAHLALQLESTPSSSRFSPPPHRPDLPPFPPEADSDSTDEFRSALHAHFWFDSARPARSMFALGPPCRVVAVGASTISTGMLQMGSQHHSCDRKPFRAHANTNNRAFTFVHVGPNKHDNVARLSRRFVPDARGAPCGMGRRSCREASSQGDSSAAMSPTSTQWLPLRRTLRASRFWT